jgi:hypothetical protein
VPLPADFYDEDKNYRIRMCMTIEQAVFVVPGSKVHQCDSCGAPIWVNENQVIPEADVEFNGDVSLCMTCTQMVHRLAEEEPQWLGPSPEDFGLSMDDLT